MRGRICLLGVLFCLLLGGCAPREGDYFAPFAVAFAADVQGSWNNVEFGAQVCATPLDAAGAREMTVTFYAPSGLCGTVLTSRADGSLSLCAGEISLPLSAYAAEGYAALLALFPTAGEVQTLSREGENTRVAGAGFSLLFSPDGVPLELSAGAAHVRVIAWEQRK